MSFAYPYILLLLLGVPVYIGLYAWSRAARKRDLAKFGRASSLSGLMPLVSPYKPPLKLTLQLLAYSMMVIALARPWGGVKSATNVKDGIEVVIAVDASNSMLAPSSTDAGAPDRMRMAKMVLEKLINRLDNDRVGLIEYAGDAYMLIPVTGDYISAKMFLNSISPDDISNQGTNIASAVEMASRSFSESKEIGKSLILITDAEELEDSESVMKAVKKVADSGVQVNVVGVGGQVPVKIPRGESYMIDPSTGAPVETSLNEDLAIAIAKEGGGIYVNAANKDALTELEKQMDKVSKSALESNFTAVHDELYGLFCWLALFFVLLDIVVVDRKFKWLDKFTFFNRGKTMILAVLIMSPMLLTSCINEESRQERHERRLISAGNDLYREGKYADAKAKYNEVIQLNPNNDVANFNFALCDYRLAEANSDNDSIKSRLLSDALVKFSTLSQSEGVNSELASKVNYNLGNMFFQDKEYPTAINLYKQSLRLAPENEDSRYNLRIAQLNLQNQENKDGGGDDDDEQEQEQEQEKEEQEQQDQPDQQDQQDQQQQDLQDQQPKDNEISPQAAQQILNAVENNEQRARVSNMGKESVGSSGSLKKW